MGIPSDSVTALYQMFLPKKNQPKSGSKKSIISTGEVSDSSTEPYETADDTESNAGDSAMARNQTGNKRKQVKGNGTLPKGKTDFPKKKKTSLKEPHGRVESEGEIKAADGASVVKPKVVKVKKNVSGKSEQKLKCNLCEQMFASENALSKHLETHGLGYECGICKDLVFATTPLLLQHINETHYTCNIGDCDYYFGSPNGVRFHMEREHKTVPHFPCHKCGKVLKASLSLRNHLMKCSEPSDSETYVCDLCNERVKVIHKQNHDLSCSKNTNNDKDETAGAAGSSAGALGGDRCDCKFCNRSFQSADEHTYHETNCYHNPDTVMTCKLCGKPIVGLQKLLDHLTKNHKQGPHLCIYCHHGFVDEERRTDHFKVCENRKALNKGESAKVEKLESRKMQLRGKKKSDKK